MSLIKQSRIPIKEIVLVGILPSFLKKLIYRMRGVKIGKGVSLGIGCVIIGKKIEIGDYTKIGFFTIIRAREIKIGKRVEIGSTSVIESEKIEICDEAIITEQVFVGGNPTPDSFFKLGKRSIIMYMSYLNSSKKLIIGDETGIGGHCIIFTHGSWQSALEGYPVKFEDIIIGNNVWLPWRVFVMPGVSIGDNSTIGANSFVNKNIPPGVLAAGNPIKILRTNDEYPKKLDKIGKQEIMEEVITQFNEHLIYHGYRINLHKNSNYWLIGIDGKEGSHTIIYCFNNSEFVNNYEFNINSALLSLIEIDYELKRRIFTSKGMIIDLMRKERLGSNDIGEEMINSLKRYGIRLERVDEPPSF